LVGGAWPLLVSFVISYDIGDNNDKLMTLLVKERKRMSDVNLKNE